MRAVVGKAEAKARGLRYYYTGRPCARGGLAPRRVSDSMCTCVRCETDRKERNARHYALKRDAVLEQKRGYYERTREQAAKRHRQYRSANLAKIIAKNRAWYEANKDKVRAHQVRRRLGKLLATPPWHGEFDRLVETEAYRLATLRKATLGIAWHVDHMLPIKGKRVCGLHCWQNLQVIPETLNLKKGARLWLTERGDWVHFL